ITKEDCLVCFDTDARHVHNQIRGLSPVPLAFTHTADGKLLKLLEAQIADESEEHERPGEVLSLEDGITVACRRGSIRLLRVLPEGKGRMAAADFVRGRKVALGDLFQ
ncbi:MAG: methionyl-tRNA formyltransferase, partial [Clostridia bacterium]|nr:methionyl-tRNA formyltransferase [Clostridia bacterium]